MSFSFLNTNTCYLKPSSVSAVSANLNSYGGYAHAGYGGPNVVPTHMRQFVNWAWEAQAFVKVTDSTGANTEASIFKFTQGNIDYMGPQFLRIPVPAVSVAEPYASQGYGIAWCANLAHNLVGRVDYRAGSAPVVSADKYAIDQYSEYFVDASKQDLYRNLVGNRPSLTDFSASKSADLVILPLIFMPGSRDFSSQEIDVWWPLALLRSVQHEIEFRFNVDVKCLLRVGKFDSATGLWKACKPSLLDTILAGGVSNFNAGSNAIEYWSWSALTTQAERLHTQKACAYKIPVRTFDLGAPVCFAGNCAQISVKRTELCLGILYGVLNTSASDRNNFSAWHADRVNTTGDDVVLSTSLSVQGSDHMFTDYSPDLTRLMPSFYLTPGNATAPGRDIQYIPFSSDSHVSQPHAVHSLLGAELVLDVKINPSLVSGGLVDDCVTGPAPTVSYNNYALIARLILNRYISISGGKFMFVATAAQ